jgi:hypothetical protein
MPEKLPVFPGKKSVDGYQIKHYYFAHDRNILILEFTALY